MGWGFFEDLAGDLIGGGDDDGGGGLWDLVEDQVSDWLPDVPDIADGFFGDDLSSTLGSAASGLLGDSAPSWMSDALGGADGLLGGAGEAISGAFGGSGGWDGLLDNVVDQIGDQLPEQFGGLLDGGSSGAVSWLTDQAESLVGEDTASLFNSGVAYLTGSGGGDTSFGGLLEKGLDAFGGTEAIGEAIGLPSGVFDGGMGDLVETAQNLIGGDGIDSETLAGWGESLLEASGAAIPDSADGLVSALGSGDVKGLIDEAGGELGGLVGSLSGEGLGDLLGKAAEAGEIESLAGNLSPGQLNEALTYVQDPEAARQAVEGMSEATVRDLLRERLSSGGDAEGASAEPAEIRTADAVEGRDFQLADDLDGAVVTAPDAGSTDSVPGGTEADGDADTGGESEPPTGDADVLGSENVLTDVLDDAPISQAPVPDTLGDLDTAGDALAEAAVEPLPEAAPEPLTESEPVAEPTSVPEPMPAPEPEPDAFEQNVAAADEVEDSLGGLLDDFE